MSGTRSVFESLFDLVGTLPWTRQHGRLTWPFLLCLLCTVSAREAAGTLAVRWATVDGGGATFTTGGNFRVGTTCGQCDTGVSVGGTYRITGGFWPGVSLGPRYTIEGVVEYEGRQPGAIIVQAYTTPAFTGNPMGWTVVERSERGLTFVIRGLPAGVYYLRAFIDSDENGELGWSEAQLPGPNPTVTLDQNKTVPSLSLADPDTDSDGLGDYWEIEHFSDLTADPTADPDGDGFPNLYEFRHGLAPELYALPLFHGWNAVSIRDLPADNSVGALLGDAIDGQLWIWTNGHYESANELLPLRGHWAYRAAPTSIEVPLPGPGRRTAQREGARSSYVLHLEHGWNLVSITAPPADASAAAVLGEHIIGPVWTWSEGRYVTTDVLLPMRAHWVYCPEQQGADVSITPP